MSKSECEGRPCDVTERCVRSRSRHVCTTNYKRGLFQTTINQCTHYKYISRYSIVFVHQYSLARRTSFNETYCWLDETWTVVYIMLIDHSFSNDVLKVVPFNCHCWYLDKIFLYSCTQSQGRKMSLASLAHAMHNCKP